MVYSKTELFREDLQTSAELFKALGHPARLAILKYLAETKTCITGDFADELPLSRTTVNQHLKELKEAGLIVGKIDGVKTCYCLDLSKIKELKCLVELFFEEINSPESANCK
jgi:ArsR family transcriptional regulator, arsenate/arsenite/antimonite-responsive transcriptional repressor